MIYISYFIDFILQAVAMIVVAFALQAIYSEVFFIDVQFRYILGGLIFIYVTSLLL